MFQSGCTNSATGLNYEAGDTIDLFLMDYKNMEVSDNSGFVLLGAA